jgi:REP element-mobilizing transposase RayT
MRLAGSSLLMETRPLKSSSAHRPFESREGIARPKNTRARGPTRIEFIKRITSRRGINPDFIVKLGGPAFQQPLLMRFAESKTVQQMILHATRLKSGTGFQPVTSESHSQDGCATLNRQTPSPFFNPDAAVSKSRRNLPHWRQDGKTYFVTFRLADSLPASRRRELERDRAEWKKSHGDVHPSELTPAERARYFELFHKRLQRWLDAGEGSCLLERPTARKIVRDALRHFEGTRYELGESVVAANHAHVLVTPAPGEDLSAILHSWKSFTAKAINKEAGRTGPLWRDENFDHLVRSGAQLAKYEEYIRGHREYEVAQASSL